MNIIFAVNDSYVGPLSAALVSILENNSTALNFYILSNDFSEDSKQKLLRIAEHYPHCRISYLQVDPTLFQNLQLNIDYISLETYYRYIIADLLYKEDKALYLDADLVVNGSLEELWDTKLEDSYCAGAKDLYIEEVNYKPQIGFQKDDLYINAGVLLLNLKQIRKDKTVAKLFENTVALADKIAYQDQDIINITFKGRIKELPGIYNFASANVKKEKSLRKKAVIIHYTGQGKPWNRKCGHQMRNLWLKYAGISKAIQQNKKSRWRVSSFLRRLKELLGSR